MNKLQNRLILLSTSLVAGAAIMLSWFALGHFERELPPTMAKTVAVVGQSTAKVIESAYAAGVPPESLVGANDYLDTVRKDNPGLDYLAIASPQGTTLHRSDNQNANRPPLPINWAAPDQSLVSTQRLGTYFDTTTPLRAEGQVVATLHLGQRASIVESKVKELSYDVLTVLIVATLIAMELLRFVLAVSVQGPSSLLHDFLHRARQGDFRHYLPLGNAVGVGRLNAPLNHWQNLINERAHQIWQRLRARGEAGADDKIPAIAGFQFHAPQASVILRDSAIDYVRWPFFLLIFSESLSLSFFPLYVEQFFSPEWGVPRELVIGLPISIFMFVWALSMPWAGLWGDRVGHRRAFMVGAIITCAGLLLTAATQTIFDLVLWRCMTAFGYGLVFVTAQSYIANNTPPSQRTKGMAIFLASFFAGSLSGAAIGGILSDRIGYPLTFVTSALLSAGTALFAARFLHSAPPSAQNAKRKLGSADFKALLRNPKFVVITFLAAIPAKIALTGFLYYSAPLYLKFLGNNQSATGRAMMAYGLVIVGMSPSIARLADRFGHQRWFVAVGGYVAAASMFLIHFRDDAVGVALAITFLGIAHSIGVSPQLALVSEFCQDVVKEVGLGTATGIFRLIERLGNVLGPMIAGILIAKFGFKGAFYGIGILCLVCATLFSAYFQMSAYKERHRTAGP